MSNTSEERSLTVMKEKQAILDAHLTDYTDEGNWQLNYGVVEPCPESDERYPLKAVMRFSHRTLKETYDVNQAFGAGGGQEVLAWLLKIRVVDGAIDFGINEPKELAEV